MKTVKTGANKYPSCYILLLLVVILGSGCAAVPPAPADNSDEKATVMQTGVVSADDTGWWQVGFHRAIKPDEEPLWHLDTLLAYEVIKPILAQQQLALWRFHRRASPDASGHTFSFIFFSTRGKGEKIYQQIKEHPLVVQLQTENMVERLSFFDINGDARANIEDTSDKKWSIELQKAWPAFIMGVSQTWLNLIEEYTDQADGANTDDVKAQVERFEKINREISSVWEMEGGHAFLHHLNALFGYQEVYVIERKKTRF
ncbi:MAG TPA: hypothetical protein VIM41_12790 [Gammaproteobacteria bacterium]